MSVLPSSPGLVLSSLVCGVDVVDDDVDVGLADLVPVESGQPGVVLGALGLARRPRLVEVDIHNLLGAADHVGLADDAVLSVNFFVVILYNWASK